jgi:hypothetical protein
MRWCVPTLRNSSRPRSISFRTWGRDIASRTAASVGLTSVFAGETTISSPRARAPLTWSSTRWTNLAAMNAEIETLECEGPSRGAAPTRAPAGAGTCSPGSRRVARNPATGPRRDPVIPQLPVDLLNQVGQLRRLWFWFDEDRAGRQQPSDVAGQTATGSERNDPRNQKRAHQTRVTQLRGDSHRIERRCPHPAFRPHPSRPL